MDGFNLSAIVAGLYQQKDSDIRYLYIPTLTGIDISLSHFLQNIGTTTFYKISV